MLEECQCSVGRVSVNSLKHVSALLEECQCTVGGVSVQCLKSVSAVLEECSCSVMDDCHFSFERVFVQ